MFAIDSLESAKEAAEQYLELGLPMPVDLTAFLESQGLIVTDQATLIEDTESLNG